MTQTLASTTRTIEVTDLVRTYGSGDKAYTAVRGSTFHVREGEVFGLLGTNGAGKTSTLELMEGLARPTSGRIRIHGRDPVADRAELRPELGIMLQSGGLPSQLTVMETMRMWHGTCSYPRDIGDVLADVDLAHRADVKVGSLSGGEQRRLDLACALLGDPSILFLDEPTTGLDPESRRHTWDLLLVLKKRGVTMVLTTHYLEEAEFLSDRIAIMDRGEIAVEGTIAELVAGAGSRIDFILPDTSTELPPLPGAHITRDNTDAEIITSTLQEHTLEILRWAEHNGLELKSFAARPANLESVFMDIAGQQSI
ncbi:ABC transporter ATP-binding protein [Corynebacterium pacaense]|uniref:ABC transporter ATP-binding protein n=1 Tax=Corynebacterium pacaense TaxID=1816684 RepID=UPI0009B9CF2A|nr:ABC transporter ATP-binding protein [Corynebacterium pacaense]